MAKQVYLHFGTGEDPRQTISVESRLKPLWWHGLGLNETATGYGRKLTTPLQVKWNGRWRRVYLCQISNSGTAYIGKPGAWLATVSQDY
jgi:hypothetical protein